jgi:exopolysaccharide biosynthesis predicted pyruvyltransferase EpsI
LYFIKINHMRNQNPSGLRKNRVISEKVFKLFKNLRSSKFIFVEPGGNFGDYLIYRGAYKLAKLAGLHFEVLKHDDFMNRDCPEDQVIYINGSGGFVPFWSGRPIKGLQKALATHKGIVVLGPTTFYDDDEYIKSIFDDIFSRVIAKDVFIFTREKYSFSFLNKFAPDFVNKDFDHDTAINLNKNDFNLILNKQKYCLYAIREDKEKIDSTKHIFGTIDPIKVARNFEEWLLLHANAASIITNRLHSAICGFVMEVPTTLMPNSYHKNRSAWEFSLAEQGVQWQDKIESGLFTRLVNYLPVSKFVLNSNIRMVVLKMHKLWM